MGSRGSASSFTVSALFSFRVSYTAKLTEAGSASTVWGSVSAARKSSTASYSAMVTPFSLSSAAASGLSRAVLRKRTARFSVT